ncbi:hypothetical protein [Jatrophihabitans sp.]|uniref:hypothetical protein n=1 Tax=Jatrophihabitans sp. TaxID=1932789 RepID=UPI0030C6EA80
MSRSLSRVVAGLVVFAALIVPATLGAVSVAAASPGTWGATQAAYLDGTVCTVGSVTSPLAAWDFGDTPPEFLLASVTSNGVVDSASLPEGGTPGRAVAPVTPGQYGLSAQADVSTLAALISGYGATQGALVARAVLQRSDAANVPNCVADSDAEALVAKAAQVAGPYTVTLTAAATPAKLGTADSLTVKVTSTAGQPVPNAHVDVSATVPLLGSGETTASVVTDSTGVAHEPFTVRDATSSSVTFTANTSVSVGLEAVTVDPASGNYAPAIYADPPSTFSGTLTQPIDNTASPVLVARIPAAGFSLGTSVSFAGDVTGMFGLSGEAKFVVQGPLALDTSTFCSKFTAKSFGAGVPVAASSTIDITGDSRLTTGAWTPTRAGCYLLTSVLNTTNSTPQVSAHGHSAILTVLDTKATLAPAHSVFGAGPIPATVTVTHSYGRAGKVIAHLRGPLSPGTGDCSGSDWSKAPQRTVSAGATKGDGALAVTLASLTKPGCYQVTATLALPLSSTTNAQIQLTDSLPSQVIYVLKPTVSSLAAVTSTVSPGKVKAQVSVVNLFGQAGHVSLQMYQAPAGQLGCRSFDQAKASLVGAGLPVSVPGDGVVTATSAATTKLGCYALVPKLVMDGNPAVSFSGVADSDDIVLAGVGDGVSARPPVATSGESFLGIYVTFGIFLALVVGTAVGVVRFVLSRRDGDEPGPDLTLLSDDGLTTA